MKRDPIEERKQLSEQIRESLEKTQPQLIGTRHVGKSTLLQGLSHAGIFAGNVNNGSNVEHFADVDWFGGRPSNPVPTSK